MIGIDTNVLVRYIVQDNSVQAKQAAVTLESNCTHDKPGFISLIVLCELVWVLRGAYKYQKPVVVEVLHQILSTAELLVDESGLALAALKEYEKGQADYADYLIARIAKDRGVSRLVTFDNKAGKEEIFDLLSEQKTAS